MTEISDALWAPLRAAVPSFDAPWREYVASTPYHPAEPGVNILKFTDHLDRLVHEGGPSAVAGLLVAMEDRYAWAASREEDAGAEELKRLMTISILERLAQTTEDAGHDLRVLAGLLPGPQIRSAWEEALAWTHPECAWDWERGLVFHEPPPPSVGRFRVSGSFLLSVRNAVVVQGMLLEGRVDSGNVLRLRLSAGFHIEGRIGAVEWIRTTTGEQLGLVLPIAADRDPVTEEAMWSGLEGETLEVAEFLERTPVPHN
jgi:hypothetical protein